MWLKEMICLNLLSMLRKKKEEEEQIEEEEGTFMVYIGCWDCMALSIVGIISSTDG